MKHLITSSLETKMKMTLQAVKNLKLNLTTTKKMYGLLFKMLSKELHQIPSL
ncbi:unnamed protein product [Meloidogyne enterolobii]|uniref:Uncharacterized protein n=1 Tax=Meloidogyne enterolobii TaxID=390850 RepID=A0ACB1B6S2_MELEN